MDARGVFQSLSDNIQALFGDLALKLHYFADSATGARTDRGDAEHIGQRARITGQFAQRELIGAIDQTTLLIAGFRRQQRLHFTRRGGQIAQRLVAGMGGEKLDRSRRRLTRMRRQRVPHAFLHQLLRAGSFQQTGDIVGQHACLQPAGGIHFLQPALAVGQHLAADLESLDAVARVVGGQAIFLSVALRGFRVQAGSVEGGGLHTGDRRRGRSHAARKRMTRHFEFEIRLTLEQDRRSHRPVVVVGLQPKPLRNIVAEKVFTGAFAASAAGGWIHDHPG